MDIQNNQEQQIQVPEYYLLLDDYRYPFLIWWVNLPEKESHKWVIARHYYEFVNIITNNGLPRFISFDHDLDRQAWPIYTSDKPCLTGLDCAQWLINYCEEHKLPFPSAAVHSTSPDGGPKIYNLLNDYLTKKRNG